MPCGPDQIARAWSDRSPCGIRAAIEWCPSVGFGGDMRCSWFG